MRIAAVAFVFVTASACSDGAAGTVGIAPDDAAPTSDRGVDARASADVAPLDDAAPLPDVMASDVRIDVAEDAVVDATDDAPEDVAVTPVDVAPIDAPTPADAPADTAVDVPSDAPSDAATDAAMACPPMPTCATPPPSFGATVAWRHLSTRVTVALGASQHRGRDLFLREGDPQWALAKFAYGLADTDLTDEDVDIWLLRDCTRWEMLGTATTTTDGAHTTVEGVADNGGRVYFPIPTERRLGVGWHRLLFVVRGDHTTAEQWINVLPAGARVVVSDVDGTLTESENAALLSLLTGPPPAANAGGAEMMQALVSRGYHVFYLTARPEWLAASTHTWLNLRGFPRGVVHTTLGLTGAVGTAAQTFKTDELRAFVTRFGAPPDFGFGNTDSDVGAYSGTMLPASGAYYYRFAGDLRGGTRVDDYNTLVSRFRALPAVCR